MYGGLNSLYKCILSEKNEHDYCNVYIPSRLWPPQPVWAEARSRPLSWFVKDATDDDPLRGLYPIEPKAYDCLEVVGTCPRALCWPPLRQSPPLQPPPRWHLHAKWTWWEPLERAFLTFPKANLN